LTVWRKEDERVVRVCFMGIGKKKEDTKCVVVLRSVMCQPEEMNGLLYVVDSLRFEILLSVQNKIINRPTGSKPAALLPKNAEYELGKPPIVSTCKTDAVVTAPPKIQINPISNTGRRKREGFCIGMRAKMNKPTRPTTTVITLNNRRYVFELIAALNTQVMSIYIIGVASPQNIGFFRLIILFSYSVLNRAVAPPSTTSA